MMGLAHLVVIEHLVVMVTLEVLEDLGGMVILEHQEAVIQVCGLEPIALDICIQKTVSWYQGSPH